MSENLSRTAVVLVAAGEGKRLGSSLPKAFVSCGGRSLLAHAMHSIFQVEEPLQVVVVVPRDWEDQAQKIVDGMGNAGVSVVIGGATRQESVRMGIRALPADVDVVLVHDAARALTPPEQFESVIRRVRESGGGVVPGIPVGDTIKSVSSDGRVVETLERSALRAIQTPQGFPRAHLVEAHELVTSEETDDAALVAKAEYPVDVIPGNSMAFKITTPWDLQRAEHLIRPLRSARRTGIGIDVHAYSNDGEMWLAGLLWPGEHALAGHSDGDAVCHAIADSLLSAAGLGDLGSVFGTDDPRFTNARGVVFLEHVRSLLARSGWEIEHVAVQLVAQRPRFAARREEAEKVIGGVVGAPVSISATTSDGLGFTGRGEGVAAIATSLLSGK